MDVQHTERVANAIWRTAVESSAGDIEAMARGFMEAHVNVLVAAKFNPQKLDSLMDEYVTAFKKIYRSKLEPVS